MYVKLPHNAPIRSVKSSKADPANAEIGKIATELIAKVRVDF